jgi:hypothetical protein
MEGTTLQGSHLVEATNSLSRPENIPLPESSSDDSPERRLTATQLGEMQEYYDKWYHLVSRRMDDRVLAVNLSEYYLVKIAKASLSHFRARAQEGSIYSNRGIIFKARRALRNPHLAIKIRLGESTSRALHSWRTSTTEGGPRTEVLRSDDPPVFIRLKFRHASSGETLMAITTEGGVHLVVKRSLLDKAHPKLLHRFEYAAKKITKTSRRGPEIRARVQLAIKSPSKANSPGSAALSQAISEALGDLGAEAWQLPAAELEDEAANSYHSINSSPTHSSSGKSGSGPVDASGSDSDSDQEQEQLAPSSDEDEPPSAADQARERKAQAKREAEERAWSRNQAQAQRIAQDVAAKARHPGLADLLTPNVADHSDIIKTLVSQNSALEARLDNLILQVESAANTASPSSKAQKSFADTQLDKLVTATKIPMPNKSISKIPCLNPSCDQSVTLGRFCTACLCPGDITLFRCCDPACRTRMDVSMNVEQLLEQEKCDMCLERYIWKIPDPVERNKTKQKYLQSAASAPRFDDSWPPGFPSIHAQFKFTELGASIFEMLRADNDPNNEILGEKDDSPRQVLQMIFHALSSSPNVRIAGEELPFELTAKIILASLNGAKFGSYNGITGRPKGAGTLSLSITDFPSSSSRSSEIEWAELIISAPSPSFAAKDSLHRLTDLFRNVTIWTCKFYSNQLSREHDTLAQLLLLAHKLEKEPKVNFSEEQCMLKHASQFKHWGAQNEAYASGASYLLPVFGDDLIYSNPGTAAQRPMLTCRYFRRGELDAVWTQHIIKCFMDPMEQGILMVVAEAARAAAKKDDRETPSPAPKKDKDKDKAKDKEKPKEPADTGPRWLAFNGTRERQADFHKRNAPRIAIGEPLIWPFGISHLAENCALHEMGWTTGFCTSCFEKHKFSDGAPCTNKLHKDAFPPEAPRWNYGVMLKVANDKTVPTGDKMEAYVAAVSKDRGHKAKAKADPMKFGEGIEGDDFITQQMANTAKKSPPATPGSCKTPVQSVTPEPESAKRQADMPIPEPRARRRGKQLEFIDDLRGCIYAPMGQKCGSCDGCTPPPGSKRKPSEEKLWQWRQGTPEPLDTIEEQPALEDLEVRFKVSERRSVKPEQASAFDMHPKQGEIDFDMYITSNNEQGDHTLGGVGDCFGDGILTNSGLQHKQCTLLTLTLAEGSGHPSDMFNETHEAARAIRAMPMDKSYKHLAATELGRQRIANTDRAVDTMMVRNQATSLFIVVIAWPSLLKNGSVLMVLVDAGRLQFHLFLLAASQEIKSDLHGKMSHTIASEGHMYVLRWREALDSLADTFVFLERMLPYSDVAIHLCVRVEDTLAGKLPVIPDYLPAWALTAVTDMASNPIPSHGMIPASCMAIRIALETSVMSPRVYSLPSDVCTLRDRLETHGSAAAINISLQLRRLEIKGLSDSTELEALELLMLADRTVRIIEVQHELDIGIKAALRLRETNRELAATSTPWILRELGRFARLPVSTQFCPAMYPNVNDIHMRVETLRRYQVACLRSPVRRWIHETQGAPLASRWEFTLARSQFATELAHNLAGLAGANLALLAATAANTSRCEEQARARIRRDNEVVAKMECRWKQEDPSPCAHELIEQQPSQSVIVSRILERQNELMADREFKFRQIVVHVDLTSDTDSDETSVSGDELHGDASDCPWAIQSSDTESDNDSDYDSDNADHEQTQPPCDCRWGRMFGACTMIGSEHNCHDFFGCDCECLNCRRGEKARVIMRALEFEHGVPKDFLSWWQWQQRLQRDYHATVIQQVAGSPVTISISLPEEEPDHSQMSDPVPTQSPIAARQTDCSLNPKERYTQARLRGIGQSEESHASWLRRQRLKEKEDTPEEPM